MSANFFEKDNIKMAVHFRPATKTANRQIIFLHGWKASHDWWRGLAELYADDADQYLVDLPGFGESSLPPEKWGSPEYADFLASWLETLPQNHPRILIGHSFGGRLVVNLAARFPQLFAKGIAIAASGIKRQRSLGFKLRAAAIKSLGKLCRFVDSVLGTKLREMFNTRFGSRDYREAGAMRPVFVRVVNEDYRDVAPKVERPVFYIYGGLDTETPPEIGRHFHALTPGSAYAELVTFDHWSILGLGKHQLRHHIDQWLNKE